MLNVPWREKCRVELRDVRLRPVSSGSPVFLHLVEEGEKLILADLDDREALVVVVRRPRFPGVGVQRPEFR